MDADGSSRRSFVKAAGGSSLISLVAGCSRITSSRSSADGDALDFAAGWEFQSANPILENAASPAGALDQLPRGTLVDGESDAERIRWDYLAELHVDAVDSFDGTDFEADEFLTVVEVPLPASHTISGAGRELVDGTLRTTYDVVPEDGPSDAVAMNNDLTRWRTETGEKPTDVAVELRYDSSP